MTEASDATELLATGLSAIRLGDLATAEQARDRLEVLADEAAKRPPSRLVRGETVAIAHSELAGEVQPDLEDFEAAEELFTASLARTPNRPRSLLGLARAYAGQGQRELAAESYAKLAALWADREGLPELEEACRYLAGF